MLVKFEYENAKNVITQYECDQYIIKECDGELGFIICRDGKRIDSVALSPDSNCNVTIMNNDGRILSTIVWDMHWKNTKEA